jgi:DNA-binding CsgD family transcriptional regulator
MLIHSAPNMNDIDQTRLEKVCAHLGDAAIDPAMWSEIIDQISVAAGATGAVLLQRDVRTSDIPRSPGLDEIVRAYFANRWHVADIRAERGVRLALKGETVLIDQDVVTPEEMNRLAFYTELLAPYGFSWFAAIRFWAGPAPWGLTIQRTTKEGPFEANDKRVLAHLSQKLTEVATLSTAVGRIALSSAANALNAIRQPAIAIDRLGFVLDANSEAEGVFGEDIQIKDRRLLVHDAEAKSNLEKLMDRLRIALDTATLPCEPIVVRRREKRPVILHVLPIHGAARTPFLGARVILTLTPLERRRPGPNAAMLVRAFGLTPAEVRVASIIARGISPEQAAEELGVTRLTVSNQIKSIFGKTDTHRQSQLVALLSRL